MEPDILQLSLKSVLSHCAVRTNSRISKSLLIVIFINIHLGLSEEKMQDLNALVDEIISFLPLVNGSSAIHNVIQSLRELPTGESLLEKLKQKIVSYRYLLHI